MDNLEEKETIKWHHLLGKYLELLLTPVGITVQTDFAVMSAPPRSDILLLRKEHDWTEEQLERLPDGIRHSRAKEILIEFKYTESVDLVMIRKTLGYDTFYRASKNLKRHHVQTFLVSAKTPIKRRLKMFGYVQTEHKGVYLNESYVVKPVRMILLNELADTPYNSFFKCFASRKSEKETAFSRMEKFKTDELPITFWNYASILIKLWFSIKGGFMKKKEITPEDVMRMGEMMGEAYLSSVSLDDFLSRFDQKEVLSRYTPEEIVKALKPEEIVKALKPEEIMKALKPEEIVKTLKPEEIMKALKPEEIEDFLRKMKSEHSSH